MIVCAAQMAGLPGDTWLRLFVWMAIGLCVYFGYGRRRSVLQNQERRREREQAAALAGEDSSSVHS
jgi:APA family basic amino acid/polyamine antiporter